MDETHTTSCGEVCVCLCVIVTPSLYLKTKKISLVKNAQVKIHFVSVNVLTNNPAQGQII